MKLQSESMGCLQTHHLPSTLAANALELISKQLQRCGLTLRVLPSLLAVHLRCYLQGINRSQRLGHPGVTPNRCSATLEEALIFLPLHLELPGRLLFEVQEDPANGLCGKENPESSFMEPPSPWEQSLWGRSPCVFVFMVTTWHL